MGFSRQEYWSGLPFPSPENLPDPGIEPRCPALQAGALTSEPPGKLFKMPVSMNSECLFCIGFLWLLSQFHQTKTKVLTELPLSRGCQQEPIPCLFQLQWLPAPLSLWPHHTNCWLSAHTVFSSSVSNALLLSLIGMHVIMFRAYPDNPGWPLKVPHLITFAKSFLAM